MEIGICRWGQGLMVLEDRRIDYTDGAVTVVPANCLHTTLSRDKSLNSWEYLFFDPAGILNSAFPNDPLFVESVLHVYRGYQLNITFNFDLTPYIEGDDAAAC